MPETTKTPTWPRWQRWGFRFFFVYFLLEIAPWNFLSFMVPGVSKYTYYPSFLLQNYVFRWHETPRWSHAPTGSGDTLDDWVLKLAYLILAVLATVVWSLFDRRRTNYIQLSAWLKISLRYYLAFIMFTYGIIKLFALQMPYPNLAQLYTPLGEFTPMRFTWMFMGYSQPYQFMSGLLETLGGLLLLSRRTLVPGLLLLAGVLSNVVMLNFFYGVPVKLFSSLLLLMCLFLLVDYIKPLYQFFWLRLPNVRLKHGLNPTTEWPKALTISLKALFFILAFGLTFYQTYQRYTNYASRPDFDLRGVYDVVEFVDSTQTIASMVDTNRWNRLVIERSWSGDSGYGHILRGTTDLEPVRVTVDSIGTVKIIGSAGKGTLFEGTYQEVEPGLFQWEGHSSDHKLAMTWRKRQDHMTLPERRFMWVMEQKDF